MNKTTHPLNIENKIATWEQQVALFFREEGYGLDDFSLRLDPLPANPIRQNADTECRARVFINNVPVAFLRIGPALDKLYKKTLQFSRACPDIACRPLFYKKYKGVGFLAQEYFDGVHLDLGWQEELLSEQQVITAINRVYESLDRTLTKSTDVARDQELNNFLKHFCDQICRNPFDQVWVEQVYKPFLQKAWSDDLPQKRWTNGDVITQNIMTDDHGGVRLVDYEFAECTHFYKEDYKRLLEFTALPKELLSKTITGRCYPDADRMLFFSMRQAMLCKKVNISDDATSDYYVKEGFENWSRGVSSSLVGGEASIFMKLLVREKTEIINLNQAVTERDGQIASIHQTVRFLTGQMADRDAAVAERDAQIVNLSQAVNKREGQIANLKRAVAARDQAVRFLTGQVADRDAVLAERYAQIVNLNHAVNEHKGQIANLNRALTSRDAQIRELKNVPSGQGERVRTLDQMLHESELARNSLTAELGAIKSSRSWKVTMPLRFAGSLLLGDGDVVRGSIPPLGNAKGSSFGVAGKFRRAVLFLNQSFHYVQENGVKESFLTLTHRAKQKRPIMKLGSSARISLQNILNRLNISLKSEQVQTALINVFGQGRTSRIMANIVDAEKFIFAQNNGKIYPLIHASQLPSPLPQTRKRNILFLTAEFPSPYHGGGNRVLNFIKTLSADNNIYLCTAFSLGEHEHILPGLASYCRDIFKIPYGRFGGNQDDIRSWLGATTIDIVHYEWPRSMENYADFGRIQIFTFMEAVSLRLLMDMERLTPLSAIWLDKLGQLAYALWLEFVQASKVDARIAVTEKDAKFFSNLYPFQEYAVLNHGLDFDEFTLPDIEAEPNTLVFVGNYLHYPNEEALEFFFSEIWGNIRKEIPDARIYVVGTNPTDSLLRRSDGKQIIITGAVADVRPYIQKASVCIAPLISGAGLRGKVVEYAALNRPFVATSIASTDFIFKKGIDYFCADTALEFSDKVITLLKDPQLARRMGETAYVTARENYGNQRLTRYLLSLYEYLENSPDV